VKISIEFELDQKLRNKKKELRDGTF